MTLVHVFVLADKNLKPWATEEAMFLLHGNQPWTFVQGDGVSLGVYTQRPYRLTEAMEKLAGVSVLMNKEGVAVEEVLEPDSGLVGLFLRPA